MLHCNKNFPIIILWEFFFRRSRVAYSAVLGRIWLKFELVRDINIILVNCNNEEDPIKNEGARVLTNFFLHYNPMGAIRYYGNQSSNPI